MRKQTNRASIASSRFGNGSNIDLYGKLGTDRATIINKLTKQTSKGGYRQHGGKSVRPAPTIQSPYPKLGRAGSIHCSEDTEIRASDNGGGKVPMLKLGDRLGDRASDGGHYDSQMEAGPVP